MSTQERAQPARKVIDEISELLDMFPDFPWLSFRTADVRALVEYVRAREAYFNGLACVGSSLKNWERLEDARRALGLEEK